MTIPTELIHVHHITHGVLPDGAAVVVLVLAIGVAVIIGVLCDCGHDRAIH